MVELKVEHDDRCFSICVGHRTKWFEQIPCVSVIEEFYNDKKEVVHATVLFDLDTHKNSKNSYDYEDDYWDEMY